MEPDIAQVAALIGDPARSKMLIALMGGKALTASELALEAEVTSQTASSHLSKLVDKQLLVVQKQGRHKYFQLKGKNIADLIETLLNISSNVEHSKTHTGPRNPELRRARVCYDHLAGEIGVLLFNTLKAHQYIHDENNTTSITDSGIAFFNGLSADTSKLQKLKRPLCKSCLDWSERRHHLAGSLGKWILADLFNKGWARKDIDSRIIRFTDEGLQHFSRRYALHTVFNS